MKPIEECAGLEEAIRSVLADAFGSNLEARLVDGLRQDGSLAVSIAAECTGSVRGYAA
jgi:predicted N-acetyltransferase YhbS